MSKKSTWSLIFIIALMVFSACAQPSPAPIYPTSTRISFLKKVTITTDEEGGSARPEVIATRDRVFVVYLGNISKGQERFFGVKVFDNDLISTITTKSLVTTTPQYGSPTDIRISSDGRYLYAFYETYKPRAPASGTTYLWGAKYTLDDSFERVAYTATPIVSSRSMSELPDGGELLDDPAPLIRPDSVFAITRLKYPLAIAGNSVFRVREFDKELRQLQQFDLDLSDVAGGRARVVSLLFYNNTIYIALATTISDGGINEWNDDGALSDIILVKLRAEWTLNLQEGIQTLSAESGDRENYVSGFDTNGMSFYITCKQAVGIPPAGEQRAWVKVYDGDFNIVQSEIIKSTIWGPSGGEIRPSLEVSENRVLSGQSSGEGIGHGNAEIYVYEIVEQP